MRHTAHEGSGRKRCVWRRFSRGSAECAAEIILGVGVAAGEARTAESQDGLDLGGGDAAGQQVPGDPQVGDTPIRLGETLWDAQPMQAAGIDAGRGGGGEASRGIGRAREARTVGVGLRGSWRQLALGCFDQRSALEGQASLGVEKFHPGGKAAGLAPCGFLIGEARQPPQMTPIGAGQVAAIGAGQLLADGCSHGGRERRETDAHPGLQVAGAGLEHHTGLVSMRTHGGDDLRVGAVQINENVAGVPISGERVEIDIEAFAIPQAQETHGGAIQDLAGAPNALTGVGPSCAGVNQTDQIQIAGHSCELPADGLPSQEKTAVHHGASMNPRARSRHQKSASGKLSKVSVSQRRGALHLYLRRQSGYTVVIFEVYGDASIRFNWPQAAKMSRPRGLRMKHGIERRMID